MGRCTRISFQIVIAAAAAALVGCSASYKATRVDKTNVNTTTPGIYYSLPKTELLVVASVKKTTVESGLFGGKAWDACEKACASGAGSCPSTESPPVISYEITSLKTYSRSSADADHLYSVKVDFNSFAAFSHTFKLTNEGVLTSSSSEVENKSLEIGINTVKSLIKLVTPPPVVVAANDISGCPAFRTAKGKQNQLNSDIKRLRASLDGALFRSPTPEGPAIEQLIKRHEARVAELKAMDYEELTEQRSVEKKEEALGDFAVTLEPAAFVSQTKVAGDWQPVQRIKTEGFAGYEAKPVKDGEVAAVLTEIINAGLAVEVKPLLGFTSAANEDKNAKSTGYRYRFPAPASVTVKRTAQPTTLAEFRTLVAQYGAITAMPSTISGIKSKVVLDLYEGTGSPRQIDVGATPLPTTAVGDALSPIQDEIDRRNAAKAEAKKAAAEAKKAEADAEKNDLTKQRDLLALKKEIAELEAALENDTEEAP